VQTLAQNISHWLNNKMRWAILLNWICAYHRWVFNVLLKACDVAINFRRAAEIKERKRGKFCAK